MLQPGNRRRYLAAEVGTAGVSAGLLWLQLPYADLSLADRFDLRHLHAGGLLQHDCDVAILPDALNYLHLGNLFKWPLQSGRLPMHLLHLNTGYSFGQSLRNVHWPLTLRTLLLALPSISRCRISFSRRRSPSCIWVRNSTYNGRQCPLAAEPASFVLWP